MICKSEAELKKQFSLYGVPPVTLLGGCEPALVLAWRRQLLAALQKDGAEAEKLDGANLDVDALCSDAMLVPFFGSARIFWVDALEPAALGQKAVESLAALLEDFPEGNAIVITLANGILEEPRRGKCSFDGKMSAAVKRLIAAADQGGIAACLDRRTGAALRNSLLSYCKKMGCELTPEAANTLIIRCGEELGSLQRECEKLCVYREKGTITPQDVLSCCSVTPDGDLYAVAKQMLQGNAEKALGEIHELLLQKTPPAQILANLSVSFCDLARAAAARTAGKTAEELAKEMHFRFAWRAKNALQDCRRFDLRQLNAACSVLCDAEATLKSAPTDDRVLLETAVVRCISALREGRQ